MMKDIYPPQALLGEGDHPKGGGGVYGGCDYPSTMLRMVPLPIYGMGRI
jgi:hypothetical protein